MHKYCHNKSLINKVFSSSRWYYVLTIGFMVNFFIIVFLVVYIVLWRRRNHHSLMTSIDLERPKSGPTTALNGNSRKKSWNAAASAIVASNANNNRGYSPVKSGSASGSTVPFHDYDSSSDEELFRKPYSDQ